MANIRQEVKLTVSEQQCLLQYKQEDLSNGHLICVDSDFVVLSKFNQELYRLWVSKGGDPTLDIAYLSLELRQGETLISGLSRLP